MTDLRVFQLNDASGKPLCIYNAFWDCPGLYLSNTCLVVHLRRRTPQLSQNTANRPGNDNDEQEALRTLLRGLGQRLLEFNLWRPVVAVLEAPEEKYAGWAADQDWHRGDFLLFIETKENIDNRINDMLDPGDQLAQLREPSEPRSPAWFRSELEKIAHEQDALWPLLDRFLPKTTAGDVQRAADEESIKEGFNDWCKAEINKAEQLAAGGSP